ncbi:hypothetical protein [Aneurinibacillus migulanus]|nr:hypothetical protein [Aneurinibacillus migulanus]MED0894389.1 hypothetical protein [Aneurinibacillus migulanus]MED1616999.1 hypothetical protein [Aneurinibacillus migulanus]GED16912.1 hypothetical protein AMI01nite_49030 [Aneurinibacillus migulanus]
MEGNWQVLLFGGETLPLWGGYTRHNVIARRTCNADGEVVSDEIITGK